MKEVSYQQVFGAFLNSFVLISGSITTFAVLNRVDDAVKTGDHMKQVEDDFSLSHFFTAFMNGSHMFITAALMRAMGFGTKFLGNDINNAAVHLVKPLVETTHEEWDLLMAINVRAAFLMIKYSLPFMHVKGGSIFSLASVHAIATSKGLAAYATSKGALVAMTRAASLELTEYKIRVNAILPGAVDTDMLHAWLSRDNVAGNIDIANLQSFCRRQPLDRIGRPEEIASAIIFLADEKKSAFISGQTLVVDGGATAYLSTE